MLVLVIFLLLVCMEISENKNTLLAYLCHGYTNIFNFAIMLPCGHPSGQTLRATLRLATSARAACSLLRRAACPRQSLPLVARPARRAPGPRGFDLRVARPACYAPILHTLPLLSPSLALYLTPADSKASPLSLP